MLSQTADIFDPITTEAESHPRAPSFGSFLSFGSNPGSMVTDSRLGASNDYVSRSQLPPGMISLPPVMIPPYSPAVCPQPVCMRNFSPIAERLQSAQTAGDHDRARMMYFNNGGNKLGDVQIRGTPAPLKMKVQETLGHGKGGLAPSFGSAFSKIADAESGLFSKKVFVGGLPPDIDEEEISRSFWRFGPVQVDWPTKGQTRHIFPPKGYVFLIFQYAKSVEKLVGECYSEADDYFYVLSSASQKNKIVQVRPWRLSDGECHYDKTKEVNSRLTAFVGGVPRPLRADQLAKIMNSHFGNVCHAVISVDEGMDYPRGAGRVTFSSQDSYINAIQTRYIEVKLGDLQKKVELKPYEDTVYERQRPKETHRQSHRRPMPLYM